MYFFIRFLIFFMIQEQFAYAVLEASHDISSSSASRFSLTPEQLQAHKEQQAMVIQNEPVKKEIGTIATLYNQVDQEFIYGSRVYKNIELKTFYEKYTDFIDDCKHNAQSFYPLDFDIKDIIYEALQANPTTRNIGNYKIVGEMPEIDFDVLGSEQLDSLFNVHAAKKYVVKTVKTYINNHYEDVCKKCCPQPLKDSKKVFRVPCCQSQFHNKCLISCQVYKVSSCPNPQCQTAENGIHYSKSWDSSFYEQTLQAKSLSRKEIKDDTCMLCEEPLKTVMPAQTLLSTLRKRVIENRNFYEKNKK